MNTQEAEIAKTHAGETSRSFSILVNIGIVLCLSGCACVCQLLSAGIAAGIAALCIMTTFHLHLNLRIRVLCIIIRSISYRK